MTNEISDIERATNDIANQKGNSLLSKKIDFEHIFIAGTQGKSMRIKIRNVTTRANLLTYGDLIAFIRQGKTFEVLDEISPSISTILYDHLIGLGLVKYNSEQKRYILDI